MMIVKLEDHNIDAFTRLGGELIEQSQFRITGPDYDHEHSLATIRNITERPDYYIRGALDDSGVPCGFVFGHVVHFYFAPVNCAYEDGWYVRPGVSGRLKIGIALMRGFVRWALDDMKAVMVQSGDVADIDKDAVWAAYKAMGFTKFGSIYKYSRGLV